MTARHSYHAMKFLCAGFVLFSVTVRTGSREETSLIGLVRSLKDNDPRIRVQAAIELGDLGPKASCVVPALRNALDDPKDEVRNAAADSLARIGRASVPSLKEGLTADSGGLRSMCAVALGRLGPAARDAVPQLLKALKDKEALVRREVVGALALVGDVSAIVPLSDVLRTEKETSVRDDVLAGLASFGRKASIAVPAIIDSLNNEEADASTFHSHASQTLGEIGADVVSDLTKVICNAKTPRSTRSSVIASIMRMGELGHCEVKIAIPALISVLKGQDKGLRSSAVDALGSIGRDAALAAPSVVAFISESTGVERVKGARCLCRIAPTNPLGVPTLLEALRDKRNVVRKAAASAVFEVRPPVRQVKQALIHALADTETDVRLAATNALGEMGARAADAVAAIQERLSDSDKGVRQAAAAALKAIREDPGGGGQRGVRQDEGG